MNALVILIFASSLLYTFQVFSIGSYGVTTLDVLLGILILVFIKKIVWDGEKLKAGLHLGLFFYFGLFQIKMLCFFNYCFLHLYVCKIEFHTLFILLD